MKKTVQLVAAGASVLALAAGCSSDADTDASGSPGSAPNHLSRSVRELGRLPTDLE